ncbi:MAG: FliM/FliN family flagellar motor switch protein [Thermoguttaceae bacterium]|nr:FliM/FliN family flagellar motor switch protein [Thermoguttaceae bacterium]
MSDKFQADRMSARIDQTINQLSRKAQTAIDRLTSDKNDLFENRDGLISSRRTKRTTPLNTRVNKEHLSRQDNRLHIELPRFLLSSEQTESLTVGAVLPLKTWKNNRYVQLYWNDQLFGEAELLINNGKMALRFIRFTPSDTSAVPY